MIGEGFIYIITWGTYEYYTIEMATANFREAILHFRDFISCDEKRIEVWLKDTKLGYYTEVIAKSEWDVNGQKQETRGLQWNPVGESE